MDGCPWEDKLSLSNGEWDLQWRLNFGGVTDTIARALDQADGNCFAWRGRVMEQAVADAVKECLPSGGVRCFMQPHMEVHPIDHLLRCQQAGEDPNSWRRADIAVEVVNGHKMTLDVCATNLVSSTALRSSVLTHMGRVEDTKNVRYRSYYKVFRPFIMALSGGVTEQSYKALQQVALWASAAASPRLDWEPFMWTVQMQRRISVAAARVTASIVSRTCGAAAAAAG